MSGREERLALALLGALTALGALLWWWRGLALWLDAGLGICL